MRAIWIFSLVAILGVQNLTLGAPLTKWFKTDNNTYYIEPEQKYTWYQAYTECKSRNLNLLSFENFDQDAILNEYLKQVYDPVPLFWLNANVGIDLANLQPSMIQQIFKSGGDEGTVTDVLNADDPKNCVLSKDGTVKGCDITHGIVCKASNSAANGVQNIQNIILKFS